MCKCFTEFDIDTMTTLCIVIGSYTHHIVETNKVEIKFSTMLKVNFCTIFEANLIEVPRLQRKSHNTSMSTLRMSDLYK